MMAQAQKLQKELTKKLAEFDEKVFEYDYKNGSVVVQITGASQIVDLKINLVLIDPEDASTLQDMVSEAINSALTGVKEDRDLIQKSVAPNGGGMF
jgi:DNA-binding YbaB/EbfC family protein